MSFVPITLDKYLSTLLSLNPGIDRADAKSRLRSALAASKAGVRCRCGAEIWVIGSAEVGHGCFTCITGEAYPETDYELAEACGLSQRAHGAKRRRRGRP